MRETLIDALMDLAGDEFTKAKDILELAKESEEQLVERLINIANWYKNEAQ